VYDTPWPNSVEVFWPYTKLGSYEARVGFCKIPYKIIVLALKNIW